MEQVKLPLFFCFNFDLHLHLHCATPRVRSPVELVVMLISCSLEEELSDNATLHVSGCLAERSETLGKTPKLQRNPSVVARTIWPDAFAVISFLEGYSVCWRWVSRA